MIELPLDNMTVADKLQAVEALWGSLAAKPEAVSSPDWHGDELKDRSARVEAGQATVSPWPEAKQRLQQLGESSAEAES